MWERSLVFGSCENAQGGRPWAKSTINMDYEYLELYDTKSEKSVPVFVGTFGNWADACWEAGKLDRAEIIVINEDNFLGTVVYSDEPGVRSGRFWSDAVHASRRFHGLR